MNYEETLLIVNFGVYYNPANKHYNYNGVVTCNRCFKTNLEACIGFNEYDLCLGCVQDILNHNKKMESKVKCDNLCIDDNKLKTINFEEKKYDSDDYQSDMMQFDLFG